MAWVLAGAAGVALARPPRQTPYGTLVSLQDTALDGDRHTFSWRLGAVSYRVRGQGTPLVLVHGINAAASSFEMHRNFGPLSADHRVYALDLLGFGLSDRPQYRYSAETYVALLRDFLREVVGTPAHLMASSLSGAFAVQAAHAQPESVRSLLLICPTGIDRLAGAPALGQRLLDALVGTPCLGRWLFAGLVTRPSVRYFLRSMTYHDPRQVTPEVVEGYHRVGQRPGGRWAPRAFLGGRLNLDIRETFAQLQQPILLLWGKEATITPLATAPAFLERNPRAELKVFGGAGLLPHDEQAADFNAYIREWLRGVEA